MNGFRYLVDLRFEEGILIRYRANTCIIEGRGRVYVDHGGLYV